MGGDKPPKRFAFYVNVFHHQIVAGREIVVEALQHSTDVVVGVFDDKPGMLRRAKELRIEHVLRIGAVSLQVFDARILHLDFDPIDRVNATLNAAKFKMIGEPDGALSEAGPDLRTRSADADRRTTSDTWRNRRRSSLAVCRASA